MEWFSYYRDVQTLLTESMNAKKMRFDRCNPTTCDMYVKVKTGGSRTLDKVYSESKLYFKYLRYGLTFLEFYNPDDPEV